MLGFVKWNIIWVIVSPPPPQQLFAKQYDTIFNSDRWALCEPLVSEISSLFQINHAWASLDKPHGTKICMESLPRNVDKISLRASSFGSSIARCFYNVLVNLSVKAINAIRPSRVICIWARVRKWIWAVLVCIWDLAFMTFVMTSAVNTFINFVKIEAT